MELFYLHGVVALIALVFKIGFLAQVTVYSRISAATIILSLFLVAQNAAEFLGYLSWFGNPGVAGYFLHFYMATLYFMSCSLVYLATVSAGLRFQKPISACFIIAALYLSYLQLTDQLISGFTQHGHTITSVPDSLYKLFLIFIISALSLVFVVLLRGAISTGLEIQSRCRLLLIAMMPILLVGLSVAILRAVGFDASTAIFLPIATTCFLAALLLKDEKEVFLAMSIKWRTIWKLATLNTLDVKAWKDTVEEELILGATKFQPNSQKKAADLIKMSQPTLSRRLEKIQATSAAVEARSAR